MNQSERGMNQNENEPPTAPSTTTPAGHLDSNWLKILDDNRKYNFILLGINETNNKIENNKIVDGMLKAIDCAHRIVQKTNIIRLSAKRQGKNRLLNVFQMPKL